LKDVVALDDCVKTLDADFGIVLDSELVLWLGRESYKLTE
jgi:hypothetical protein